MKQEEIMRIEMEMKEALQDEQLRNQETAKYHKISTIYRPFVTLGQSVFLRFACQEGIGLPFLEEIRDMLQETEKTSNLMATKEKDTQDRGGNVIGYRMISGTCHSSTSGKAQDNRFDTMDFAHKRT